MVIANAAKHKGRLACDARIEDAMNFGIVFSDLVELVDQQGRIAGGNGAEQRCCRDAGRHQVTARQISYQREQVGLAATSGRGGDAQAGGVIERIDAMGEDGPDRTCQGLILSHDDVAPQFELCPLRASKFVATLSR